MTIITHGSPPRTGGVPAFLGRADLSFAITLRLAHSSASRNRKCHFHVRHALVYSKGVVKGLQEGEKEAADASMINNLVCQLPSSTSIKINGSR